MPLDQESVGPHDVPIKRDYTLPNGNVITSKRTDPYGHWVLSAYETVSKGEDRWFLSVYTSPAEVERAIKEWTNYLNHLPKKEKNVKGS
jgi:hypothetical protein